LISTITSEGAVTFKNCGAANDAIQLKGLTITPHPIKIPVQAMFSLTVALSQNIANPIKTQFILSKKVLLFWVQAPCENNVGSCTYADWCVFCPTCGCPLLQGTPTMNIPMNLTSTVPTGDYKLEVRFTSNSNQKGCVLIEGIQVTK